MICLFQQVFDLIIVIRFISIKNPTIWKFIDIILLGINIAKASSAHFAHFQSGS